VEPTRAILRTTSPQAGWVTLRSTVTVPPGATSAVVRLKCTFAKPVQWDQVSLERIETGPDTASGELTDQFEGARVDDVRWFHTTATGGVRPPEVRDGWLIYDDAGDVRQAWPITSYTSFNQLLSFKGAQRYRMQFRVARVGQDASKPSSLDWSLQAGTGPIQTLTTGMYWTHSFAAAGQPMQVYCYAAQGEQNTYLTYHPLSHLPADASEVWYTLEFDPSNVTIYAAAGAYDTSEASRVAQYPHDITDLTANGDIYLKIQGRSCLIADMSVTSAAPQKSGAPQGSDLKPEGTDPDLTMPGVTDQ
jgi:hypothetical protein